MYARFSTFLLLLGLLLGTLSSGLAQEQPVGGNVQAIPALPSSPSAPTSGMSQLIEPSITSPERSNTIVPPPQQEPMGVEAGTAGLYIPPLPIRAEPPPNRKPQPAPTPPKPTITYDRVEQQRPPLAAKPLQIVVQTEWPALIDSQKTMIPVVRSLTLEAERVQALREKGFSAQLEAELKKFIDDLRTPKDSRFEPMGGGWGVVQGNGIKIDFERSRLALSEALKNPEQTQLLLPVLGQVAPERTLDYFASKGITAHLGSGATNYYGSSPERIVNIKVGTKRFQDRLVSGNVVSFNQIVGPISRSTGYVTGLVIAGDQTASGVGGGICQVSTTVFRTLYVAGLPIIERRPHSYQVFYYAPQGLDATIYQPNLDLKFANNTGSGLWFQAEWNDESHDLSIHVFGKPRPYTVHIDGPKVLRETPPPPDRFVKDPKLPKGERKQIDWAAKGAEVEVTRRLMQGGKVIAQDTLRSSYRPWPNIYLIGDGK